MNTIYLIRHGAPEGAVGAGSVCLGSTDAPLAPQGRFQAALVGLWLGKPDLVWTSPLIRCRQTAEIAFGGGEAQPELREIHMGEWDGLSFDAIRAGWPELYQKRGEDPIHVVPPGGEAPEAALTRMEGTVARMAQRPEESGAAVAHAGVLRLFLCKAEGRPLRDEFSLSQPYGCVNKLTVGKDGLQLVERGVKPCPDLMEDACCALLAAVGCDAELIAHCRAVARASGLLADALNRAGGKVDKALAVRSALLHDMARGLPRHGEEAARWLDEAGYAREASIVRLHHDWGGGEPGEAAVVCWADRRTMGSRPATLAERFAASEKKCSAPEAKAAHHRRAAAAQALEERLKIRLGAREWDALETALNTGRKDGSGE